MKFITISKETKYQLWGLSINPKTGSIGTANGINYFYTKRNYYHDRKVDKIRYKNMTCENASYDILVDLYLEIYPGIYSYFSIATENSISEKLETGTKRVQTLHSSYWDNFKIQLKLMN